MFRKRQLIRSFVRTLARWGWKPKLGGDEGEECRAKELLEILNLISSLVYSPYIVLLSSYLMDTPKCFMCELN